MIKRINKINNNNKNKKIKMQAYNGLPSDMDLYGSRRDLQH